MRNLKRFVFFMIPLLLIIPMLRWIPGSSLPSFQRQVIRTIRQRFPDCHVAVPEPFRIECDFSQAFVILNVEHEYQAWRRHPRQWPSLITHQLSVLRHLTEVGDYNEVRGRIFPVLRDKSFLRLTRSPGIAEEPFVHQPFLGSLVVVYCVEYPNRTVFITGKHLDAWKQKPETLHNQAIGNLLARTRDPMRLPRSPGLFGFLQGDGYDAARILILDQLQSRCGGGNGPMYVSIPHRDALYVLNPDGLDNIRIPLSRLQALTGHLYRTSHRFLRREVLIWEQGHIRPAGAS